MMNYEIFKEVVKEKFMDFLLDVNKYVNKNKNINLRLLQLHSGYTRI